MADNLSAIAQEMELSMAKEMATESHGQNPDTLLIEEVLNRGYWSLEVSQHQQKMDSKPAGSGAGKTIWNMIASWPKRGGTLLPEPIKPNEASHEDGQPQEYPSDFQDTEVRYECNSDEELIAEIDLQEFNGLELEIMRRQIRMMTERLYVLEDKVTSWHYKGAVFFTMLMSAYAVNLWLLLRH